MTIAAGTSLDVIEMDAASNRSVDDIRDLRERVGYAPAAGHWKVYILDEAHMLTREAWNAFLKTLEEPPPNTVFILATTEPHKVMPTIVDRCQRFDFQRPSLEQIAEVIRRVCGGRGDRDLRRRDRARSPASAAGSFRDALGTLDQLVSYGGKQVSTDDVLAVLGVADAELILAAADAIAAGDGRAALEVSERLARSGRDVTQFARDLLAHLRQLIVIRTVGEAPDAFTVTAAEPERLRAQAEAMSELDARARGRHALDGAGANPRGRRAADDGRAGAAARARGRSSIRRARRLPSGSSGWRRAAGAGGAALPLGGQPAERRERRRSGAPPAARRRPSARPPTPPSPTALRTRPTPSRRRRRRGRPGARRRRWSRDWIWRSWSGSGRR